MKVSLTLVAFSLVAVSGALAADRTVVLPADPPARRTVALSEQWRLGEDDEDVLLGVITFGLLDDQGQVLLVDRQLSQVLVIGPDGQLITTLGREGDGPGELRRPHAALRLDDGVVGVIQGFPGRIIGINADGTPAGDITFGGNAEEDGGFSFVRECVHSGATLVARTGRLVFDTSMGKAQHTSTLAVYDMQGARTAVIAEQSRKDDMSRRVYDEAAEFSELDHWAAGPSGLVYTAPVRDGYDLAVSNLQGTLQRTLHRPFTSRRREQADKDEIGNGINIVINGKRVEPEIKALDTDPAIADLAVAADGRLFVTSCYGRRKLLPIGTAARYDVISPDDEFLEELTLTVPDFDGSRDMLMFLDGTHFLVIKNFDSANAAMEANGDAEETTDTEGAPLSVICLTMP